jgi:hypothetical protein
VATIACRDGGDDGDDRVTRSRRSRRWPSANGCGSTSTPPTAGRPRSCPSAGRCWTAATGRTRSS